MKFNITCKVGVYSNPIKITFNNKSKILTYKNSKIPFNFDVDTEYELTMLILYTTRIIKVTAKFRKFMFILFGSIIIGSILF